MRHRLTSVFDGLKAQKTAMMAGKVFVLTATIMSLGLGGCDNKRTKLTEEEMTQGLRSRGTVAPSEKIVADPRCELSEKVKTPDENSPEWVVQEIYAAAAAKGDDDANFKRFYKHFDESIAEKWARDQYWPRVKQHVGKYLEGETDVETVFTICDRRQETPDSVKLFIKSNDTSKSNPPITLKKMPDGTHRIVFFTY